MSARGGQYHQSAPRRPQRRVEQAFHQQVAAYINAAAPGLIWFHCPNGGARSAVEGAILKSMGVRAGVADLVFVMPTGKAAFIELKAGKGKLSDEQIAFRDQVVAAGGWWAEARTLEEVELCLRAWLEPLGWKLRATVAGVSR